MTLRIAQLRPALLPLALGLAFAGTAPAASAGQLLLNFDSSCPSPAMVNGIISCGAPPPAGGPVCSPTPASISAGATATLNANCSGAASITWFNANSQVVGSGPSFTTPALTASTTYYAQGTSASNVTGNKAAVNVAVAGGGGGGASTCGGMKVIDIGNLAMGPGNYPVKGMSGCTVAVASITIPAVAGHSYLTVQAFGGSQTYYQGWVSRTRCGMSATSGVYYRYSNGINMKYAIGVQAATYEMQFQPGETWYIMVKEVSPTGKSTCSVGTCDISVQAHLP